MSSDLYSRLSNEKIHHYNTIHFVCVWVCLFDFIPLIISYYPSFLSLVGPLFHVCVFEIHFNYSVYEYSNFVFVRSFSFNSQQATCNSYSGSSQSSSVQFSWSHLIKIAYIIQWRPANQRQQLVIEIQMKIYCSVRRKISTTHNHIYIIARAMCGVCSKWRGGWVTHSGIECCSKHQMKKKKKRMNTKRCDGFRIKSENNFVWNAGRDRGREHIEREQEMWHEIEKEKLNANSNCK